VGRFISFHVGSSLMPFEMRRRAWQHAREEARGAYRDWTEVEDPDRAAAFAVYRAAEEREAAAADAFGG
jgi:Spy/CpxP family protein refolding chaperone